MGKEEVILLHSRPAEGNQHNGEKQQIEGNTDSLEVVMQLCKD